MLLAELIKPRSERLSRSSETCSQIQLCTSVRRTSKMIGLWCLGRCARQQRSNDDLAVSCFLLVCAILGWQLYNFCVLSRCVSLFAARGYSGHG